MASNASRQVGHSVCTSPAPSADRSGKVVVEAGAMPSWHTSQISMIGGGTRGS